MGIVVNCEVIRLLQLSKPCISRSLHVIFLGIAEGIELAPRLSWLVMFVLEETRVLGR